MMVDEQIQSYRISFELTKPNHSNPALLVPWCWSSTFSVNSDFDPELMERVHMNVTSLANSQSRALVKGFAKVSSFKFQVLFVTYTRVGSAPWTVQILKNTTQGKYT